MKRLFNEFKRFVEKLFEVGAGVPGAAAVVALMVGAVAFAQEAKETVLDKGAGISDMLLGVLVAHGGVISTGLVIVLTLISKLVSTEKSGPIVTFIQSIFDGLAKLFLSLGKLFAKVAELLAFAVKSDGFMGKK